MASAEARAGMGGTKADKEKETINKLTNVEAQRIVAVLQDLATDLHHLLLVEAYTQSADTAPAESEAIAAAEAHAALEAELTMLVEEAGSDRNKWKALQPEISAKEAELVTSTRALVRTLRRSPETASRFRTAHPSSRSQDMRTFARAIDELRALTFERLLTTVEEEKAQQDKLSSLMSRERKATTEMERLRKILQEQRDERERAVGARDETIRVLGDNIDKVKAESAEYMKQLEKDWKAKEQHDMTKFAKEEADLRARIEAKKQALEELVAQNRNDEMEWRKHKLKAERMVVEAINKYDTDLDQRQTDLETLQGDFETEEKRLTELQRRADVLGREFQAIVEENKMCEAQKAREVEEMTRMIHAATKVASVFRMYMAKKELAALKKKKKKKKKKKSTGAPSRGGAGSRTTSRVPSAQSRTSAA